jgi:hypothetical protein
VYVPKGQAVTPVDKAVGAWLWSGRRATAAGLSAAALHGMKWIDQARTAFDLGRRQDMTTAVIRLDALRQATRLRVDGVAALVDVIEVPAASCNCAGR